MTSDTVQPTTVSAACVLCLLLLVSSSPARRDQESTKTSRLKCQSPTSAKHGAAAEESTSAFTTVNASDCGHQSTLEGSVGSVAFMSHRSRRTRRPI